MVYRKNENEKKNNYDSDSDSEPEYKPQSIHRRSRRDIMKHFNDIDSDSDDD
tara:strand:- start:170 stop:325 length:156 start_codon:yes stop_codon:yes gene_type:complete